MTTCHTCPFWNYTHDHDFEDDEEPSKVATLSVEKGARVAKLPTKKKKKETWEMGECRLNPPILRDYGDESTWEWPMTHSLEWCGQHPSRAPVQGVAIVPHELTVDVDEDDDDIKVGGTD
jgi:hypothetical protein